MSPKEIRVQNVEEMNGLAASLGKKLETGDFILLTGELGAGKTTFVQGLAKALGVSEKVVSPTFTVVGEYKTDQADIKKLVHVDLYRLSVAETEKDVAMNDILEDGSKESVIAIEWADRLSKGVPGRVWRVEFKHGETQEERVVSINLWPKNKK